MEIIHPFIFSPRSLSCLSLVLHLLSSSLFTETLNSISEKGFQHHDEDCLLLYSFNPARWVPAYLSLFPKEESLGRHGRQKKCWRHLFRVSAWQILSLSTATVPTQFSYSLWQHLPSPLQVDCLCTLGEAWTLTHLHEIHSTLVIVNWGYGMGG